MRLLVTRPLPDALETAERARALGHEALVQPLLTIVFAPAPRDVPEPAAILVTSRNALRALQSWPQMPGWLRTPMFVTGAATARDAEALGFADVREGGGDAASIARAVQAGLASGAGPLLYPAARDRTGALAEVLTAAGHAVLTVEAYRAAAAVRLDQAVRTALAEGTLDGVLLYSRRTAEAFRTLATKAGLGDRLGTPTTYVLSEQVAAALAGTGARVEWPAQPDEESLFRLIGPAR
jgi:uroporphyrinogen-III synthase